MKFTVFAVALSAFAITAEAHARVWSVSVNGQDQGDGRGTYIRSPPTNDPVKDVASSAIKCNVNDSQVPRWVTAAAGDTLTFEWYHNSRGDDIIAASHKGPVLVYIAPASGGRWTKIAEDGLSGGQWAVDKLLANRGKHSVRIPSSLKAGNYLFRAEIIALHEGESNYKSNPARGAQFYPSCAQVTVIGSGSASPPGSISFPGTYTSTDPGILFNIYSSPTYYPIPGGSVWYG